MTKLRDDLFPVSTADSQKDKTKMQQQTNEINKKFFKSLYTLPHIQQKSKIEDDFNCIICMNTVWDPKEC